MHSTQTYTTFCIAQLDTVTPFLVLWDRLCGENVTRDNHELLSIGKYFFKFRSFFVIVLDCPILRFTVFGTGKQSDHNVGIFVNKQFTSTLHKNQKATFALPGIIIYTHHSGHIIS